MKFYPSIQVVLTSQDTEWTKELSDQESYSYEIVQSNFISAVSNANSVTPTNIDQIMFVMF